MNESSICTELIELLEAESATIDKQNKIIAKLTNENFEQENFIRELMREHACDIEVPE